MGLVHTDKLCVVLYSILQARKEGGQRLRADGMAQWLEGWFSPTVNLWEIPVL